MDPPIANGFHDESFHMFFGRKIIDQERLLHKLNAAARTTAARPLLHRVVQHYELLPGQVQVGQERHSGHVQPILAEQPGGGSESGAPPWLYTCFSPSPGSSSKPGSRSCCRVSTPMEQMDRLEQLQRESLKESLNR